MANALLFFGVMFQSKLLALTAAFTAAALLEMNHNKYLFDILDKENLASRCRLSARMMGGCFAAGA